VSGDDPPPHHRGLPPLTREVREAEERERLSPLATRAPDSRGRERPEPEDAYRTAFERDRDRILHSKAFRRLKHKTQVFLNPDGDHFVTRMTHTLQVAQVGRSIAAALGLNEALTEAICLGHDIGHSPFGHTGEDALSPYVEGRSGSTRSTACGSCRCSSRSTSPGRCATASAVVVEERPAAVDPEGWCAVRRPHRLPRPRRAGRDPRRRARPDDVPAGSVTRSAAGARVDRLDGPRGRRRVARGRARSRWSRPRSQTMHDLRDLDVRPRLPAPEAVAQARRRCGSSGPRRVVREHPDEVPDAYRLPGSSDLQAAVDHVAGMSDKYAIRMHDELFRPAGLY
jgi:dGTPase